MNYKPWIAGVELDLDTIRDHDVKIIGHELRGYMTDMKSIAESSSA